MKNILLSLSLLAIGTAFGQNPLTNPSFETFANGEPTGWSNSSFVSQTVPGYTGTYAVKGLKVQGDGDPQLSLGSGNGLNISTRYTYLSFYYKFNKVLTEKIVVSLYMDNPSFTIGGANYTITEASAEYRAINIPISYSSNGNPSSVTIDILLDDNSSVPDGSFFVIDDISLGLAPIATAITEVSNDLPFSIYPNPANGVVNITMESYKPNSKAILYDLQGREMQQIELTAAQTAMDISTVANGLYIMAVKNGSDISMKKIQVTK